MAVQTFIKDPEALLDYQVDWAAWLGADTIDTSVWSVPTGLTAETDSKTNTTATIWLSGGTSGQTYRVTNQIETVGGRTDERSFIVRVEEQ